MTTFAGAVRSSIVLPSEETACQAPALEKKKRPERVEPAACIKDALECDITTHEAHAASAHLVPSCPYRAAPHDPRDSEMAGNVDYQNINMRWGWATCIMHPSRSH